MNVTFVEMEATQLRNVWAVRPKGRCGTCGFYPVPWTVQYIKARTESEALSKAKKLVLTCNIS